MNALSTVDIRYKQRFENFKKAQEQFAAAITLETYSVLERAGTIQFFEFTIELGWKVLKDFLEANNYVVKSPKDTIKIAFNAGYIKLSHTWMKALEDRNLLSHTYDETNIELIFQRIINDYNSIFIELMDLINEQ